MTDPIVPAFITGGALVLVNGAIVWIQGRRRRDDIRRREKDNAELLLGQKAEEYYLSATKSIHKYEQIVVSIPGEEVGAYRQDLTLREDDFNHVRMFETYYFPFLFTHQYRVGKLAAEMLVAMQEFRERLSSYPDNTRLAELIRAEPIMTEYEKLKKLFDEKYARALEFLNDLSTMDLYKLRSEWRRKFPLR
jgi:hypothetical protein